MTNVFIVINLLFFLIVSWQSGSLLTPSGSALFLWGAKDSFKILEGEYWRYLTPVFLHIGVVHFLVNNYSLRMLGPHAEKIFGSKRFVLIYLLTGFIGNVASASYQPYPGAGASGALFGILGACFWFEWNMSRSKNPLIARSSMVKSFVPVIVINVIIGLMVPMIDQAAHLGGLVSGVMLTEILLSIQRNNLRKPHPIRGFALILVSCLFVLLGLYLSSHGIFLGLNL